MKLLDHGPAVTRSLLAMILFPLESSMVGRAFWMVILVARIFSMSLTPCFLASLAKVKRALEARRIPAYGSVKALSALNCGYRFSNCFLSKSSVSSLFFLRVFMIFLLMMFYSLFVL